MNLGFLSIQRVTNRQPIAYDNAQRYHALRNVQPVVVGNGYYDFRKKPIYTSEADYLGTNPDPYPGDLK